MSKILVIMRHAQAAEPEGQGDRERPLTDLGRTQARETASWLQKEDFVPRFVACSSALRTCQTLEVCQSQWQSQPSSEINDLIYLADPFQLRQLVDGLDDEHNRVMIVGHNPGLSQFAFDLCHEAQNLGTAQALILEHQAETWLEAEHGWKVKATHSPRL